MRRHPVVSLLAALSLLAAVPVLARQAAAALPDPATRPAAGQALAQPAAPDTAGMGAWWEPTDLAGPGAPRLSVRVAGGVVDAVPGGLVLTVPGASSTPPARVGVRFVGATPTAPAVPVGRPRCRRRSTTCSAPTRPRGARASRPSPASASRPSRRAWPSTTTSRTGA